jgi:molybdopterin converting factor subunit 1
LIVRPEVPLRIQVLLFASYADAFQAPRVEVALEDGATVRDLIDRVRAMVPGRALPPSPMVAINQSYAQQGERIRPGDEVALIPPVAGG